MRWCGIVVLVLAIVPRSYGGDVESTLAMVKPDAIEANWVDSIKLAVNASGFGIIAERKLRLEESEARDFYAEHSKRAFFSDLVQFMTSGPVLAMVLQKHNAIADWRELIGPTDPFKARTSHPHRFSTIRRQRDFLPVWIAFGFGSRCDPRRTVTAPSFTSKQTK